MILYIENPKGATRKLLERNNEFGKVAGYKINAQKSVAFLYINNERSEREIQETIPFAIASKRIKYLGTNLSKETKDLSSKNYKIPVLQNYNDTNGKISCSHGMEQLILLKHPCYPKQWTQ